MIKGIPECEIADWRSSYLTTILDGRTVGGMESPADFDVYTDQLTTDMVNYFHAKVDPNSPPAFIVHAKASIAERFNVPPLQAAFHYRSSRLAIVSSEFSWYDPSQSPEERKYYFAKRDGQYPAAAGYKPYLSGITAVAFTYLVVKGDSDPVGVAGIKFSSSIGLRRHSKPNTVQEQRTWMARRIFSGRLALAETVQELYPEVIGKRSY